MEIVDAQVHLNHIGLEAGLLAMDAAGVDAAVIDEHRGYDDRGRSMPGYPLPSGSLRHVSPFGELAATLYPDRLAYLTRCEPDDDDIASFIASVRTRPGRLALRLLSSSRHEGPVELRGTAFAAQVRRGGYADYFALASEHRVPVFLQVNGRDQPGDFETLSIILRDYPDLIAVLDHIGIALPSEKGPRRPHRFDQLDDLLRLSRFPNLSVKWGHAVSFSEEEYPYADVSAQLHRVVDAFGAQRVMWASDWTMDRQWSSWAQTFTYIRDDTQLSREDREWILGRTVRTILSWPRPNASMPSK